MRRFSDLAIPRKLSCRKGILLVLSIVMLPVLLVGAGFAVDMGRLHLLRSHVIRACDAAAMGAITAMNLGLDQDQVEYAAELIGELNLQYAGVDADDAFTVTIIDDGETHFPRVRIQTEGIRFRPILMILLGADATFPIRGVEAQAERYAVIISLVLDVSGSMSEEIGLLREAAKDFVDTLDASLRSTSKPLCDSMTTRSTPSARAASTRFWTKLSRMPKDHLGIRWRGLATGV